MIIKTWLANTLQRQYPAGKPQGKQTIEIPCARGERVSFQACFYLDGETDAKVSIEAKAPAGLSVQIRRVGNVPMPHFNTGTPANEVEGLDFIPGLVPDVLYPEAEVLAGPREVYAFWINVNVPASAKPGCKQIMLTLRAINRLDGKEIKKISMQASVYVSEVVLKKNDSFPVTHWFYADAICDWYKVEPFDKAFWPICEKYVRDFAEHGSNMLYVPVFTPPLDGVKRPTQLLGVKAGKNGRYSFDWRYVKQWIEMAKKCGIQFFEWTHLFTQWGCKNAIRIYQKKNGKDTLLWPVETEATSKTYRNFLSQYLTALKKFLEKENILEQSFFHISDEPHGEEHRKQYRVVRAMMRELAPWMKIMDALSEIEFGKEGLVDMPIASIASVDTYRKAKIPCWAYFCCGPRGKFLNRLLDTPLAKIRMSGSLFYRFEVGGFLHWGYNYWYKRSSTQLIDPFKVSDATVWPEWPYGDTFVVYPGADGPLDSIRWEVFAESLQDYTLFKTLGVDPKGKAFSTLKGFDRFPKDGKWLTSLRWKLLFPKGK
jgi:hypothetical protein